jgi:hypothetical protein
MHFKHIIGLMSDLIELIWCSFVRSNIGTTIVLPDALKLLLLAFWPYFIE